MQRFRFAVRYLGWIPAALVLAGCGTSSNLRDQRVLRVGVTPDYPPIVFKTNGVIRGVEADLAAYAAQRLEARLEFVELPFDDLIPRLNQGAIDVIMSGMTDTDYRRDDVRFVVPYMSMGQMALVRAGDVAKYSESTNVYGTRLKVACISGTTSEMFVKENTARAECISVSGPEAGIAELREGKVDMYIDDAPFVLQAAKDNPGLAPLQWLLTDEHLAWAVSKNKGYDELYEKLNRLVLHAKQNGDLRRIINRYFEIHVRVR